MHHKHRKPTTRRWSRRYDSKEYRQQEKRAIEGGRIRNHPWDQRQKSLPMIDQPSNGKVRGGKKPRKPKDKCIPGHTHEWYKEEATERSWYWGGRYCEICGVFNCVTHGERRWYTRHTLTATCINCWKSKVLDYHTDYDHMVERASNLSRYGRRLRRPHRPQNLYEG